MIGASELLGMIFGPVGQFVDWSASWIPRYVLVRYNQRAVRYVGGRRPRELRPGWHWHVPSLSRVVVYWTAVDSLEVESRSLETADGVAIQLGCVVVYRIADVLKYEVDNVNAVDNMAEAIQGAMRDIALELTWERLARPAEPGSRLEAMLTRRMGAALERFGIEVISCRPTDQVRLTGAHRLFGVQVQTGPG